MPTHRSRLRWPSHGRQRGRYAPESPKGLLLHTDAHAIEQVEAESRDEPRKTAVGFSGERIRVKWCQSPLHKRGADQYSLTLTVAATEQDLEEWRETLVE